MVLGSYLNAYSIIQELTEKGVLDIFIIDFIKMGAAYSNKIKKFQLIKQNPEDLLEKINRLHELYDYLIIYPTEDIHIEYLYTIYSYIHKFSFIPFNTDNILLTLNKYYQYAQCEKLGVPYPKTINISNENDLDALDALSFPILIKPVKREDIHGQVFRNLQIHSKTHLEEIRTDILKHMSENLSFIASEIIPGDGSQIYSYVGYRSFQGDILNEWIGKKLSQYPNDFGIFASASNNAPSEVLEQGRKLLHGMNLMGIAQPEFKYDCRDGYYKLMEINLRSMMWNRVGNISGINVQYTQYLDALNLPVPKQEQNHNQKIHYIYLKHELLNIISRHGYYKTFLSIIKSADKISLAFFDLSDIKPCIIDTLDLCCTAGIACLKKFTIFEIIIKTKLFRKIPLFSKIKL
ncbi:MAG: hypothetical protein GXY48_12465 [Methanomicrobiales archaeon]|nr:hypothetical protein [Methanomicrobiales archaeon]